ncbi:MAG: serine hydrolase domain-containing protein [Chthoniobacterales bacterium]
MDADALRTKIEPLFQQNFASRGELGAAVSIWRNGEPLLELHGGFRDTGRERLWTDDTIVLVWSATKGIGSACLLHVLQEHGIDLHQRVAEFWPEFAQNGKGDITIAQMVSHQAGLPAIDAPVSIFDYDAVIAALARQKPLWTPGAAHGYHARTFGFLIDELVRRITGVRIATYWREVFAEPLQLDFWIGLPGELNDRCATIYAAKSANPPEPAAFYRKLAQAGTLQRKTFTSPAGLESISAMNTAEMRALKNVAFSGIGSASALAKFYGMLANGGEIGARRFFHAKTIAQMSTSLVSGTDCIFEIPTSFSAGFMKDSAAANRRIFGPSADAFGHPGAGGSNAFADPENRIAFAYVMNQMEQTLLPNDKSLRLVDVIYAWSG